MATKPTKRILDWASGGSTVDPGAGKEAAGWLVSERPPANWWNWILQSFGDWLTWGESSVDDIETDIAALKLLIPVSVVRIRTSPGGSPSIEDLEGATPASTNQSGSGVGDTGGVVGITYGADVTAINFAQVTPIWDNTGDTMRAWPMLFDDINGKTVEFVCFDAAGAIVDFDDAIGAHDFIVTTWGVLA